MIVPTANYPTSRDYRQLWELAHTAAVVCIVGWQARHLPRHSQTGITVHSPEWSPELVEVRSRGITHVWAESMEAFIAGCEQCNLEWLVPPTALAQPEREGQGGGRIISIAKAVQEHAFGWEPDARLIGNVCAEDVADLCSAILARWGRPTAPPAPEVGEVREVREWLEIHAAHLRKMQEIGAWPETKLQEMLDRAATLLQQPPAPAPAVVAPEDGETEELVQWLEMLRDQSREAVISYSDKVARIARIVELLRQQTVTAALPAAERLRIVKRGIVAGYNLGHHHTVEGGWGDPDEVADDYAEEALQDLGDEPAPAVVAYQQTDALLLLDSVERAVDGYDLIVPGVFERIRKAVKQLSEPAPAVVPVAVEALTRLYWWGGGAWSYGYSADVVLGVRDWINGGMAGDLPPLPAWVADRCPPLAQAGEGEA